MNQTPPDAETSALLARELVNTLRACTSNDKSLREAAEESLARHESVPTPGYLSTLVSLSAERSEIVPEDIRLLALIVAKNSIDIGWAKRVSRSLWKNFPEDERRAVRNLLPGILATEPSETIATQASLLIKNIALVDYPEKWPTLLDDLLRMGLPTSGLPLERRHRPLKTIKYVSRVLERKRFVLEEPSGAPLMTLTPGRLQELGAIVEMARAQMRSALRGILMPLMGIWEAEFEQSQGDEFQRRCHMKVCRSAISACACTLWSVDSTTDVSGANSGIVPANDEVAQVLSHSCSLAARIADLVFGPRGQAFSSPPYSSLEEDVDRIWERLIKVRI